MVDLDREILAEFARNIRLTFPEAEIRAYGSRVRDDATDESDLDVCIVLDHFDDEIRREVSVIAWQASLGREVVISTLVYSRYEFETGPCSVSPLVQTILKEGVAA